MAEEIRLEGLGIAPGVLETIITLAAQQVDGVACVCPQGLAGLVHKGKATAARSVDFAVDDAGALSVSLHIEVNYGQPVRGVAQSVQDSVADAVKSQIGAPVAAVDVFVDGIVFEG